MDKHMILYRGSLKSCNYHCSYCPFSKHPMSQRELDKDRMQWFSFVESFQKKAKAMQIGALMVVPYGEAMIHSWYWEGLARISALEEVDVVGIQTNLSFSINEFLSCYDKAGGVLEKLRLWGTFHPEMTTMLEFSAKCRELYKKGVQLCAGSVGVPQNLPLLQELKQELEPHIYLWINKMDGLQRPYTKEERAAFLEIDPYFGRELMPVDANAAMCQNRLFVEADGRLHTCNISPVLEKKWEELVCFPVPKCSRKQCSCYLAYGGRQDVMNHILFGTYPLFRIPTSPRAVFLDIEGTLLHTAEAMDVSTNIMTGLEALAKQNICLLFATTLPYKEAMERCHKIRHLFGGGVFAGGAHLVLTNKQKREYYHFLEDSWFTELSSLKNVFHFRVLTYQSCGKLYKVILLRPVHKPWTQQEADTVMRCIEYDNKRIRYYIENNCLQIVSANASKASGVEMLCRWLDVCPKDAIAVGDSKEDKEMMEMCY